MFTDYYSGHTGRQSVRCVRVFVSGKSLSREMTFDPDVWLTISRSLSMVNVIDKWLSLRFKFRSGTIVRYDMVYLYVRSKADERASLI